ncbi:MAG: hypothetical protein ACYDCI_00265 [Candidatus Limnocylindrales bacterium]
MSALPPALSSWATPTQVSFFDGQSTTTQLPNVAVVRIDEREGPSPAVATFMYLMDDNLSATLGWPSTTETIWPIDAAPSPYVVENDDRLIVEEMDAAGNVAIVFDGFAQIPQADLQAGGEQVTFTAISVSSREWDSPIRGRYQRNGDTPKTDPSTGPIKTAHPCRFNPSDTDAADGNKGGILANCTPDDGDVNEGDDTTSYPIFLDPAIDGTDGTPAPQTMWTISKACRYLMSVGNPKELYVNNPDFTNLTSLLQANYPAQGSDTIGAGDQTADIVIRDYDASDKPWPEAVAELLSYAGFGCSFVTSSDASDLPQTELTIYRHDALTTIAPKKVYLQPAGGTLGQGPNNVVSFHLARDCSSIVNQWQIESPLRKVEASFILAPLYIPVVSDAQTANRKQYLKSSFGPDTTAVTRRAYRWYGIDEIADGHWDPDIEEWDDTGVFDFSKIFPPDSNGRPTYVNRYRPGEHTLISVGGDGAPHKAELAISLDYDVDNVHVPGVWDGTGTWFTINGGWRLLKDRCGIEVTIEDPENWNASKAFGDIRGISWFADPTTTPGKDPAGNETNGFMPVFRLTTVVDDDQMLLAKATKRTASPTQFTRRRRADCRDHFQYNRILAGSLYNSTVPAPINTDIIARDDTQLALAHAYGLRSKTEFPPLAGQISLPFVTGFYELGDRIGEIDGRNINLQTNVNASQGEKADYPFIVSRSRSYQMAQSTMLQLSDRRAEAENI